MKKNSFSVGRFFLYLFAFLFVVFILYPYFVMFFNSFKNLEETFAIPGTILPKVWRWENYVQIWKDVPLATYFKNSLIVAVVSTALCIVCAVPAGYALARMHFPGKRFIMAGIIITQMFSEVVLLVGIYKVMVFLKLQNTLTGIILLVAAFNQAFAAWMLQGTFTSISSELEEAAMIDGCNRFDAMTKIILPLAAPGIVTAIIFVFIHAWNEYTLTLVLIGDANLKTINVGIHSFFGYTNTEWWYVFAASLLAILPILAFFQVLEKHLIGGLTAGSVKG